MVKILNREIPMSIIIFSAVLLLALIIGLAIGLPGKSPGPAPAPTPVSVETYIQKAKDALNAIAATGKAFSDYATDYVNTRTNLESSVGSYLTTAGSLYSGVQAAQQSAKGYYNTANGNNTNVNGAVATAQANSAAAVTAYNNINTLVNSVTANTSSTDGVNFGIALTGVQNQKATVAGLYSNTKSSIDSIQASYDSVKNSEQNIATLLTKSYTAVNTLNSYITSLLGDLQNSSDYKNLQTARTSAQNLLPELQGIVNNLASTDTNKTLINGLISSINSSLSQTANYLTIVQNTFTQATSSATVTINGYINQLITYFNNMIALIGTLNATPSGSPVPFTTPVTIGSPQSAGALSGDQSIIGYYNSTVNLYNTISSQYNTAIGYYNNVITQVNNIETLTNNVVNSVGTNFNNANASLLQAQGIMKKYYPGSTTPGVGANFTTPVTYTPVPTQTTVGPNVYTTFVPNTGTTTAAPTTTATPVTGSANISNFILSKYPTSTGYTRLSSSNSVFFSITNTLVTLANNQLTMPLGSSENIYFDGTYTAIRWSAGVLPNFPSASTSVASNAPQKTITVINIGTLIFNVSWGNITTSDYIYIISSATST